MSGEQDRAEELEALRSLSERQLEALDDAFAGRNGWRVRACVAGLRKAGLVDPEGSTLSYLGRRAYRRALELGYDGVRQLRGRGQ